MKITDLLVKENMLMDLKSSSKKEVISELAGVLYKNNFINDLQSFTDAIIAREEQSTTGMGDGIAIPHAKTDAVNKPAIMFGRSRDGVEYEAFDGQPSNLFFMIAAPANGAQTHLDALAKLSGMLMNEEIRNKLLNAESKEEILSIIDHYESDNSEEEEVADASTSGDKPYIIAVTACPTGIAHTYMAKDALMNKAKEMNVDMKVETNGSSGVKNKLTKEDIERADGVIVAADVNVDVARFNGKNVVQVPVADGIHKSEELISKAQDSSRVPFKANQSQSEQNQSDEQQGGIGNTIYRHLMNGVSNMLPFVVGGGILIALSFFWGIKSADPNSEQYNVFAEALNTIGAANAFTLMVPVLAGFIAMSIADRPGLAPGMVGGMIAMNGNSGFIGGLIAGFLAGYLVQLLKKIFAPLPQALDGLKPMLLYPLFGIAITGLLMIFAINPVASSINEWMNTTLEGLNGSSVIILGLVLGGMMAIDMGGPFNKAAYVFGIAALEGGNAAPITAAMIGGMIPPLAISVATIAFKNKFTPAERASGPTNIIMGLSFITEGAIPFAAQDPLRVIPSMVIASATAAATAMAFGANINAPHGGVFVFWLDKPHLLGLFISLIVGTVIGALLLGVLKPKKA